MYYDQYKRILDALSAGLLGLLLLPVIVLAVLVILIVDRHAPFFSQVRPGKDQQLFVCYKLRSMRSGFEPDKKRVTTLGKLLRRTAIDELPQLWNVLKGEMSMVGPRPCLISQQELIQARLKFNIFRVKPGITGLAQISGIDMSDPLLLAKTERKMLRNFNILSYFYYIFLTVIGFGLGDRIKE